MSLRLKDEAIREQDEALKENKEAGKKKSVTVRAQQAEVQQLRDQPTVSQKVS